MNLFFLRASTLLLCCWMLPLSNANALEHGNWYEDDLNTGAGAVLSLEFDQHKGSLIVKATLSCFADVRRNGPKNFPKLFCDEVTELPDTTLPIADGSIEVAGALNDEIEAVSKRRAVTSNEKNHLNIDIQSDFYEPIEEPIEGDAPGVGVTGPAYSIVNVPRGKRLRLRAAPNKTAPQIGSLYWDATEVLVRNCTPAIDSLTFEKASHSDRLSLLNKVWCEVVHFRGGEQDKGFIPGHYLKPLAE